MYMFFRDTFWAFFCFFKEQTDAKSILLSWIGRKRIDAAPEALCVILFDAEYMISKCTWASLLMVAAQLRKDIA